MKILAFSPFDAAGVTGNAVTLRRLQAALAERGHEMELVEAGPDLSPEEAVALVRKADPDLLHFYHAYRTGRLLPALSSRPCAVTVSGTDLNDDWEDPSRRPIVEHALSAAKAILTYNRSLADRLRAVSPRIAPRVRILPKGVVLGGEPCDLRLRAGLTGEPFIFFHPGGVRPVKNNIFALDAMVPIARERPCVRLVFAGPILDGAYGEGFAHRLRRSSWAVHVERIPHAAMAAALAGADVVLNTSRSEGLSNALMEAMAAGRAILASDIPGNRDLLEDGRTALLYRDRNDFQAKATRLLDDPALRTSLGEEAAREARRTFSTDREMESLLAAYHEVRSGAPEE